MTIETKADYQLRGNPIVTVPVIGNLVYDELGREVLVLHNERFKGVDRVEDSHDYEEGQPISYSNVPRVLSYNQILRERFPDMHVLSPYEVVQYWDAIPERDETYADTESIVIYPNEGPNEDLRQEVLAIIGKNAKKVKVPLIVSGLGVEKADDDYGFTFTETEYIKTKDAPFLQKDGKVKYDGAKLVSSDDGVNVWTPSNQSGLRWLYRDGSDVLSAGDDVLLDSGSGGRVQLIQEPQGRVKNLEALVTKLNEERNRQVAEIEARFERSLAHLKTGKKF